MLYAVLKKAEGAVVKVEQHTHTIALLVGACFIVAALAVAAEASGASVHEPAAGAFAVSVVSCRVEVGPADADEGESQSHTLRQQLHLPIILALCELGFSSRQ
jgi:hypothetical protein